MQKFPEYTDATIIEMDEQLILAKNAFFTFRSTPLFARQELMYAIADKLEQHQDELLTIAAEETRLTTERLKTELERTVLQWKNYADYCASGLWLQASIDSPTLTGKDIRKTMTALGPVAVFGAGNFPFAYSTAGGDTASAIAAGCPVIVKAHPGHPHTCALSAQIIQSVIKEQGFPLGVFQQIHGKSFEVGAYLVKHPFIKAVGFTGSYIGGKQIFDWGQQRPEPIPVFAEMGSSNPVFIFPDYLEANLSTMAENIFQSITQSAGQFCTKPGLLMVQKGSALNAFADLLQKKFEAIKPLPMVHAGIHAQYKKRRSDLLETEAISILSASSTLPEAMESLPTLAIMEAAELIKKPDLGEEVFGPFSIIVACNDISEYMQVANILPGQLTMSIFADRNELREQKDLMAIMQEKAGRINFNSVPTGVDVCLSMQHGGPFPASTDGRFSSVGGHAIQRFCRPVAYQNCPDDLLPNELKNENLQAIWRTVNGQLNNASIVN